MEQLSPESATPVSFHVKFNPQKHAPLRFTGCGECTKCCDGSLFNSAILLVDELADATRLFPTIFTVHGKELRMALVYTLKSGVPCPYLDTEKKRCSIYDTARPRACRNFPFNAELVGNQGTQTATGYRYSFSFDTRCPAIKEADEGIPLVKDGKELSPEILDQFIGMDDLRRLPQLFAVNNQFLAMVSELGLLSRVAIAGTGRRFAHGPDEANRRIQIRVIASDKLQQLSDDKVLKVFRSGLMGSFYNHILSMANLPRYVHTAFPAAPSLLQTTEEGQKLYTAWKPKSGDGEKKSKYLGVAIPPTALGTP